MLKYLIVSILFLYQIDSFKQGKYFQKIWLLKNFHNKIILEYLEDGDCMCELYQGYYCGIRAIEIIEKDQRYALKGACLIDTLYYCSSSYVKPYPIECKNVCKMQLINNRIRDYCDDPEIQ